MYGDMTTHVASAPSRRGAITLLNVAEGDTITLPIGGIVQVIKHDKRDGLTLVEGQNGRTLRVSSQTRVELSRVEAPPAQLVEYERVLQTIAAHENDPDEQGHVQAIIAARKVLSKCGVTID